MIVAYEPVADVHDLALTKSGVSLEFIRKFVADHAYFDGFQAFTTHDVSRNIVQVEAAPGQAYKDLSRGQCDEDGVPLVADATVYVSHAWQGTFREVLEVLEAFNAEHPDSYFWLDVFVVNQHVGFVERPPSFWDTEIKDLIQTIGTVVVVMAPYERPLPLTRAWCLWEMLCASEQSGVQLHMQLPGSYTYSLQASIQSGSRAAVATPAVQAEYSQATLDQDSRAIHAAMQALFGMQFANDRLTERVRQWRGHNIVLAAQAALLQSPSEASATLLHNAARLLDELGMYAEGVVLHEQAVAHRAAVHADAVDASIDAHRSQAKQTQLEADFELANSLYENVFDALRS